MRASTCYVCRLLPALPAASNPCGRHPILSDEVVTGSSCCGLVPAPLLRAMHGKGLQPSTADFPRYSPQVSNPVGSTVMSRFCHGDHSPWSQILRRSEPSSRTAFMGEQPNPWDVLPPQVATSRHRNSVNQTSAPHQRGWLHAAPGTCAA